MQETASEIARLQAVIERSIARAGPFLRSSFEMPDHSLSAAAVIAVFADRPTVALATVTATGEPRVAPIACLLVGGVFYVPTTRTAARYRMALRQPAVSLTAFTGIDLAVIVHGRARAVGQEEPEFARIEAVELAAGGSGPRGWGQPGEGCYLAIEPETIVSFTRYPTSPA